MCRGPAFQSKDETIGRSIRLLNQTERDESGATNAKSSAARSGADSHSLRSVEAFARTGPDRIARVDWSRGRWPARAPHGLRLLLFSRAGALASELRAVGQKSLPSTGEAITDKPGARAQRK